MGVKITCLYIIDKCTHGLKCSEYCDQDFCSGHITCDLYVGKDERIGATCFNYSPCEAVINRTFRAIEYESDIGLTIGKEFIPRDNIKYLAMDYGDGKKIFIDEREGEPMKELTFGEVSEMLKEITEKLGKEPEKVELIAYAYEKGYQDGKGAANNG